MSAPDVTLNCICSGDCPITDGRHFINCPKHEYHQGYLSMISTPAALPFAPHHFVPGSTEDELLRTPAAASDGLVERLTTILREQIMSTDYPVSDWERETIERIIAAIPAPDLVAENARLREALIGMIEEYDQQTRYGSPMAKAANPRVQAARAAIKDT